MKNVNRVLAVLTGFDILALIAVALFMLAFKKGL